MKWYDFFSSFYDNALEKLYFESRRKAVELLDLREGQTIIDIACGTGANFTHIRANNNKITLYGTDHSNGMLKKAQSSIIKNNWTDTYLFQADARLLTLTSIEKYTSSKIAFDRVICVLGLSVIPEWKQVLNNLIELLNENGKIVIVDVFAERRDFNTWIVEKLAKADLNRKIWQELKMKTDDFQLEYLPVQESKVGGRLFAAVGTRRKK